MKAKKLLLGAVLSAGIFGCGGYDSVGISDDNTAEARRYEVQQALDEGNYDFVIQALENDPTYGGAFTREEGLMNLAAAYVGRAGFDINDVINELVDIADQTTGNDDFSTFIRALTANLRERASLWLRRASETYAQIAPSCTSPATEIERDACFYRAVVDATNAAATVATVVEDVNTWLNPTGCSDDANQNNVGDEADATACAIEYAVASSPPDTGSCSISAVTYSVENSSLTFDDGTNTYTFKLLKIDVSPSGGCSDTNTFYRLIDTSTNSVAVTEGYCDINFNPCSSPDGSNCFPCPVVDPTSGNAVDIVETVVNTIETSQDIITNLVAGTDAAQAVNDFIQEVCGVDQSCTQDEIANYLQSL